ncbi:peroxidase P7-like [Canna indica]|uniref:Peroxidase P7-like n=1 Tax=Canna indica TaxID=4628 RepID=A0AAQ3K0P2_9LILI|nr:peroxidase P7-like [Canna indica]
MQLGEPRWTVQLGRRDATIARQSAANNNLPGLGSRLAQCQARCTSFRSHVYNDTNVNAHSHPSAGRTARPSTGTATSRHWMRRLPSPSSTSATRTWCRSRGCCTRTKSSSPTGRRTGWSGSTAATRPPSQQRW